MRLTLKSLLILATLLVAWHGAKAMAEDRVLDEFEEFCKAGPGSAHPACGWNSLMTPVGARSGRDTGFRSPARYLWAMLLARGWLQRFVRHFQYPRTLP